MFDKSTAPRFILIIMATLYLGFVGGAAVYSFRVTPYPLLHDAFLAADALYKKHFVYETEVTLHEFLWAPARRPEKGVTVYHPGKAFEGVTLVLSTHAQEAALIDMTGRVLHKWALPFSAVWPNPPHIADPVDDGFVYWRAGYVYPNGDLLVIYVGEGDTPYGYGLVKMDKDSRVVWKYAERVHHDLDIGQDGRIYTLIHRINRDGLPGLPGIAPPFIEDFVVVLSPDGEELKRVSVLGALRDSDYRSALNLSHMGGGDLLHTNTVELVDRTIARPGLTFAKGQVIVSMRTLTVIAAIDLDSGAVVWAMRGPWRWQHDPDLLADGNILIFDNLGHIGTGGSSRLIEFDPLTQEIVWQYTGDDDSVFYSLARARQQRLPNGNTLVTESQGGRLFEVTAAKKVVWEYVNPNRAGKNQELVAWLTGGMRFDVKDLPFLARVAPPS
jgi:hypothetical protein